jgi:hypothetical protein
MGIKRRSRPEHMVASANRRGHRAEANSEAGHLGQLLLQRGPRTICVLADHSLQAAGGTARGGASHFVPLQGGAPHR